MPQVGVGGANADKGQESGEEQRLSQQQQAPFLPEEPGDFTPPEKQRCAGQPGDYQEPGDDRAAGKVEPAQAHPQPRHVADSQQTRYPGQYDAPVGQRPKNKHAQRQGHQEGKLDHQQPYQHRHVVDPTVPVDDVGPGPAGLLCRQLLVRQHQLLAGGIGACEYGG